MKFYIKTTDSDGLAQYTERLLEYNIYENPDSTADDDDERYIIEITTLEDLVELSEKTSQKIILIPSDFKEKNIKGYLEIYDYYRE